MKNGEIESRSLFASLKDINFYKSDEKGQSNRPYKNASNEEDSVSISQRPCKKWKAFPIDLLNYC